jgi:aspartyl aminopeptidase
MPDLAAIAARKTDPYTGYNFLAAHTGSPLLAALRRRFSEK